MRDETLKGDEFPSKNILILWTTLKLFIKFQYLYVGKCKEKGEKEKKCLLLHLTAENKNKIKAHT